MPQLSAVSLSSEQFRQMVPDTEPTYVTRPKQSRPDGESGLRAPRFFPEVTPQRLREVWGSSGPRVEPTAVGARF